MECVHTLSKPINKCKHIAIGLASQIKWVHMMLLWVAIILLGRVATMSRFWSIQLRSVGSTMHERKLDKLISLTYPLKQNISCFKFELDFVLNCSILPMILIIRLFIRIRFLIHLLSLRVHGDYFITLATEHVRIMPAALSFSYRHAQLQFCVYLSK